MTFRLPDAPHAVPPIPKPRFRQRRDDLLGQERYGGRLFRHGVPRVRAGGADATGLLKGTAKPPGSCKATILGDHEQPEEKGQGCWKPSVVFCRRLCGCSCPQWVLRLGYVRLLARTHGRRSPAVKVYSLKNLPSTVLILFAKTSSFPA